MKTRPTNNLKKNCTDEPKEVRTHVIERVGSANKLFFYKHSAVLSEQESKLLEAHVEAVYKTLIPKDEITQDEQTLTEAEILDPAHISKIAPHLVTKWIFTEDDFHPEDDYNDVVLNAPRYTGRK